MQRYFKGFYNVPNYFLVSFPLDDLALFSTPHKRFLHTYILQNLSLVHLSCSPCISNIAKRRLKDLVQIHFSFTKIRYEEQKSVETGPRGKHEPEMDRVRNILQHNLRKERNCEKLEKLPKATQTNLPPPLSAISQSSVPKPISVRQDSNVSSDSFSQTSSPSYTSKTMEAPLLPHKYGKVPGKSEFDDCCDKRNRFRFYRLTFTVF